MSPQSGRWWVLCRRTVRSDWVSGSKKRFSAASRLSWVESVIGRVGTVLCNTVGHQEPLCSSALKWAESPAAMLVAELPAEGTTHWISSLLVSSHHLILNIYQYYPHTQMFKYIQFSWIWKKTDLFSFRRVVQNQSSQSWTSHGGLNRDGSDII